MVKFSYSTRSATNFFFFFFLFLLSLTSVPVAEARVRYYKWEVKYEFKSPDCYKKLVITINGRSPGPTIIAQQNDTIIVEVKNSLLTENLAIHWHGIRQVAQSSDFPFFFLIQRPIS